MVAIFADVTKMKRKGCEIAGECDWSEGLVLLVFTHLHVNLRSAETSLYCQIKIVVTRAKLFLGLSTVEGKKEDSKDERRV